MDLAEMRRQALRDAIAAKGGHAAAVRMHNLSPSEASYLSQLAAAGSAASFGERSAENWERKLKLAPGTLVRPDRPPSIETDLDAHEHLNPVRRVKLKLAAGISGFAVEPDDEEGLPIFFRSDWLAERGYKPYDLLAIKIRGRSMEPSLHDGDMVVINTADTALRDGVAYAVNYEGEPVIKRLMRDAGEWWLASDNPDKRSYPNKRWVDGATFIVGKVIHKQTEHI